MKIEYGVLKTRRFRKEDELENELNRLAEAGWRVKCSVGSNVILFRKVEVK